MENPVRACPFSNRACIECAVYRGRHQHLIFSKQRGENINEQEERPESGGPPLSVEFQALTDLSDVTVRLGLNE